MSKTIDIHLASQALQTMKNNKKESVVILEKIDYQKIINSEQIDKKHDTIWITQTQIASIFNTTKQNISLHIQNIYNEGELSQNSTVKKILTVQIEGNREVNRELEYYNLDMVIATGYRINSTKATQFRIWATKILKNALLEKPKELSRKELALLVIQQEEEKEKLLLENQKQQDIIKEQEKHLVNSEDLNYTTVAKNLHVHPIKFVEWLRDKGYINKKNVPYQEYIDRGYFSVKSHSITLKNKTKGFTQGFIKPKGYSYFLDKKIKGDMNNFIVTSYVK